MLVMRKVIHLFEINRGGGKHELDQKIQESRHFETLCV